MRNTNQQDGLLTLTELARLLDIHQRSLWGYVWRDGWIEKPEVKIKGTLYYTPEQVERITANPPTKPSKVMFCQKHLASELGISESVLSRCIRSGLLPAPDSGGLKYKPATFWKAARTKIAHYSIDRLAVMCGMSSPSFRDKLKKGEFPERDVQVGANWFYSEERAKEIMRLCNKAPKSYIDWIETEREGWSLLS